MKITNLTTSFFTALVKSIGDAKGGIFNLKETEKNTTVMGGNRSRMEQLKEPVYHGGFSNVDIALAHEKIHSEVLRVKHGFLDSVKAIEFSAEIKGNPRSPGHGSDSAGSQAAGYIGGRPRSIGHGPVTIVNERNGPHSKLTVTICAFDVMRDLTQSEFEKAVLLHGEVTLSAFLLLPSIRHYLDRAVFFARLSEQTNNLVHITKAYKRAHLVCMVLKYFLKDKHSNMAPSARLRTAIKKGLYA